jgi:hypothetical protein
MRAVVSVVLVTACQFQGDIGAMTDAPADGESSTSHDGGGDGRLADATVDGFIGLPTDARADAAPDNFLCPPNYYALVPASSSRYRVASFIDSWSNGELDCEADGSGTHLAVIGDLGELTAVDAEVVGAFWIGVSDRQAEGSFLAVTRQAVYARWDSGEPNDGLFGQDCVRVQDNGNYDDDECSDLYTYVCECDGTAADPSAF